MSEQEMCHASDARRKVAILATHGFCAMYQLHYWPTIPGRGEYVRLALEYAGVEYIDVARQPRDEGAAKMR